MAEHATGRLAAHPVLLRSVVLQRGLASSKAVDNMEVVRSTHGSWTLLHPSPSKSSTTLRHYVVLAHPGVGRTVEQGGEVEKVRPGRHDGGRSRVGLAPAHAGHAPAATP